MKSNNNPLKEILIIIGVIVFIAGGCSQKKKRMTDKDIQSQPETTTPEDKDVMHIVETPVDTLKMVIDHSYLEKEKIKEIYYLDSEYDKYGIPMLNTLGMTSEDRFIYDDTDVSFSIVDEIRLYKNIRSLIIRGKTEHILGVWLVNYDLNHAYIDSYPIGYDEWAEGASWKTSVIYILPESYIKDEYINWEDKENNRIEILTSGKFKITQTVYSKHEM